MKKSDGKDKKKKEKKGDKNYRLWLN